MIGYRMELDYALAPGWLDPFVEALVQGRALGRACRCGRVSFPPVRVCDCGSDGADWLALPGTADIAWRTDGSDGAFGLVRFDGADTLAVARLHHVGIGSVRCRLRPSPDGVPQMAVEPLA